MAWILAWALALGAIACSDGDGEGAGIPENDPALSARGGSDGTASAPSIDWAPCDTRFECARVPVPLDYSEPDGTRTELAVTRLPARDAAARIGSLFVNFGGPGAATVALLHDFGANLFDDLNQRFDIVGFDLRGTGDTEGAYDCHVDQEVVGLLSQPLGAPGSTEEGLRRAQAYVDACLTQDLSRLVHVSTANAARDMDLLRSAVGDAQLSYIGFSYGTFLGATYASLFPDRYRALVLDGGIDADQYINRPSESLRAQAASFELALDRFFEVCAENQAACFGFGGSDPEAAFDDLVALASASPLPTFDPGGRTLDGDDLLVAAFDNAYDKYGWTAFAEALAAAELGDGRLARSLADSAYYRREDGSYDPDADRFFLLSASEQNYPSDATPFLGSDEATRAAFPHFRWTTGLSEAPMALLPVRSEDGYRGPFSASSSAPTIVVVGTTYDPATPYAGAERLVAQLGNAVLLTMDGDGHTAYGSGSPCIDVAVDGYLESGIVPAPGTRCPQLIPFEPIR